MREELPSAAFTNRKDSPLSSELSTLAAKRKIGKNPSFASCVNVRKCKNAPRKILRRFFFRRGHFPLSSEGPGKTVRSWESIRFFLRRRLFKLGRGYNTASGDGVAWTAAILEKEAGRKLASNDNLAYTFAI